MMGMFRDNPHCPARLWLPLPARGSVGFRLFPRTRLVVGIEQAARFEFANQRGHRLRRIALGDDVACACMRVGNNLCYPGRRACLPDVFQFGAEIRRGDEPDTISCLLAGFTNGVLIGPDTLVELFGSRNQRWQRDDQRLAALIGLARRNDLVPAIGAPHIDLHNRANLRQIEHLREFRSYLGRLRIDAVTATEDQVNAPASFSEEAPDRQGERARGSRGIGAAEGTITQMDGAVGSHRQRRSQRLTRLGWSHRHGNHFPAVLIAETYGLAERVNVQLVDLQWYALAHKAPRLCIKTQCRKQGHLFDAHNNGERPGAIPGLDWFRHPVYAAPLPVIRPVFYSVEQVVTCALCPPFRGL